MHCRAASRSPVTKVLLRQFFENKHNEDSTLVALFQSQVSLFFVEVTKRANPLQVKICLLFRVSAADAGFYFRPNFFPYFGAVSAGHTHEYCLFDFPTLNRL